METTQIILIYVHQKEGYFEIILVKVMVKLFGIYEIYGVCQWI